MLLTDLKVRIIQGWKLMPYLLCLVISFTAEADPRLQVRVYYAMNAPDRPANDQIRDFDRRPIEVLQFFGIESGMTVLELMSGTGYYTELLSAAVDATGKVYAQNDIMAMRMRNGAVEKVIKKRLTGNRLANVELLIKKIRDLDFEEEVDAATLILNLHDLYIFGGEDATLDVLSVIMRALKPGGILGIVDHVGSPVHDNSMLHRIDPVIVDELLYQAGFVVTGRSDILANPEDDHTLHVFEPEIKGKTDRMVIRAIKPNYSSSPR